MATRATAYRPVADRGREDATRLRAQVTAASLAGTSGTQTAAELLDVSIYGCRLTAAGAGELGGAVQLSLAGSAAVSARVVWNREGVIGCRFDAPISRAMLRSLTIRQVV